MDLPATQAIDEEQFAPTQRFITNENNENTLVGMILIKNKEYLIVSGVTTIGRHPGCTIVINHETVSKKHAEIEAESVDGPLFIKDLNSCNMTKINNCKLRPNSSYQIKDGDKLIFGQVTATFKLHHTLDDSFIASTPQVNKKIRSVIPGTPDSSIGASSTSESDVSAIPGTQIDEIGKFSQSPEKSIKTSMHNEQNNPKHPACNLHNFSSSISKNRNNQNDINEIQTQRYSISQQISQKDFDNSICISKINKFISTNKYDSDENIYEMETQRPFNLDEDKNDIENLEKYKFNKSVYDKRKSSNLTIYSAETQKINSETPMKKLITNFEIHEFDNKTSDSDEKKSKNIISINSAETQKINYEASVNNSIENLETQQFNYTKFDFDKKNLEDMSDSKTFDFVKDKSSNEHEDSIYTAITQKIEPKGKIDKSIENMDTQKFHTIKPNKIQIHNLFKGKSNNTVLDESRDITMALKESELSDKSLYNDELQKKNPKMLMNESIKNIEIRKVNSEISDKFSDVIITKFNNELSNNIKSQKNVTDEKVNNLKNGFETQCLEHLKSTTLQTPIFSKRKTMEKSLQKIETYNFIPKVLLDSCINKSIENFESQNLIKRNTRKISDLESSVEDVKKIYDIKEKLELNKNTKDCDTQHFQELSFDSGFRTVEQENDLYKSNSKQSEDGKMFNLQQLNPSPNFSLSKINKSTIINYFNKTNNLQKNNTRSKNESCSSPLELDKSVSVSDAEQMKNIMNDKNEVVDEIFCSQNLIQDCPFEFLSEESRTDDESSTQKKSAKIEECKSKHSIKNESINENQNLAQKYESAIIIVKNLSTDDDLLINQTYKINENQKFGIKSYENNSDTDKSISSKENDYKEFHMKNKYNSEKINHKDIGSDSETDEEGIFLNYLSQEVNTSSININVENKSDINKNKIIKKYNNNKNEEENLNSPKNKTISFKKNDLVLEALTTDSEDSMFGDYDEHKCFNQGIDNSLQTCNINQNENTKALFNSTSFQKKIEKLSPTKIKDNVFETEDINLIPILVTNKRTSEIGNVINTDSLDPIQIITKQTTSEIKEIEKFGDIKSVSTQKYNELYFSKIIDKQLNSINTQAFKNVRYEIVPLNKIDDIEQKMLFNSSKRQLEESEVKCNKKSKKDNNFQTEKIDIKTSIERNLDKEMLLDKSYSMCETKKAIAILNDTIEQNLNEMFDNTINTIEEYKSDGMLTQQLESVLQSQDDCQSNIEETMIKQKSLHLSINSGKKQRLSLSMNLGNFSTSRSQDEQEKSIQSGVQLNSNVDKQEITLPESNLNEEFQDTEIYFANLKSNRKPNLIENSESKDESKSFRTPSNNDKKIVKKQKYSNFSSIDEVVNIKECVTPLKFKNTCFTNDNHSYNVETLCKIPVDTSKVSVKKHLSLRLSKNVNLNLSQTLINDHEVETTFSTEQQNPEPSSISNKNLINEPISDDSMSNKYLKYGETQNLFYNWNQDLPNDPEQQQSSPVKVSTGDLKDNSKLKLPRIIPPRNKKPLKSEVDNSCQNHPNELTKDKITDIRQSFKLQEVSVLISPLRENVLSRFMTEHSINIDFNKKANFKQSVGTSIDINTSRIRRSSKSPKTIVDLPSIKKSRSDIENKDELIKNRKLKTLNSTRAICNLPLGCNNGSSKENLIRDDYDVDSMSPKSKIRITRLQRNKCTNSCTPDDCSSIESNMRVLRSRAIRQDRNKDIPLKETSKLKRKAIIIQESDSEKSDKSDINKESVNYCVNDNQNCKKIGRSKIINIKGSRNGLGKNVKAFVIENAEIINNHRTRTKRIKDVKESHLKKIKMNMKNENPPSKNKRIENIKNLDSNKTETNHIRTRSSRIKDIKNSDLKKSQIIVNKELRNKPGKTCNQFLNSLFLESNYDSNRKNISDKNVNTNSRSIRIRKRIVNLSKESQEVADILKNVEVKDSKCNSPCKEAIQNNNNSNSESNKSDSNNVFDRPISKIKRVRLNKSIKRNSILEHNKLSKENSLQRSSRKCDIPSSTMLATSPLTMPLRSKRSLSTSLMKTSYKVLFTGDKSKAYSQTVTKLGGTVTEDPAKCTILVTDKIRRTFKFLCSVTRGIPVVSLNWLDDSSKAHHFLDWENYYLDDLNTETEFKFKLIESLKKARNQKLFKGYTIILTPHITQPPISELKDMIILSGGKCLLRAPKNWPEKTIVITKKDDIESAKKLLEKAPISVTIHSTEFILTGMLRQHINLKEYKLSTLI